MHNGSKLSAAQGEPGGTTPLKFPEPSSIPAGISGRFAVPIGTRACRVSTVYSVPSHSSTTRMPTDPPRMKTTEPPT